MSSGIPLSDALIAIAEIERYTRANPATPAPDGYVEMYVSGLYHAVAALYPVVGRTLDQRAGDLSNHVKQGRHATRGARVELYTYINGIDRDGDDAYLDTFIPRTGTSRIGDVL